MTARDFGRLCAATLVLFCSLASAASAAPQNYLFLGGDDPAGYPTLLARPDIAGAQVVYTWRELEPQPGKYDLARIDADLATVTAAGKQLVVQVQDRFFSPDARNLPDYLLTDPVYGGGLVAQTDNAGAKAKSSGWVAVQWNDALRGRFQRLLAVLATRYDGRIGALTLPETAIDIDMKHDRTGFSCDAYFDAELDNLAAARRAFVRTRVVQYVNFWPCEWNDDHHYMSRLFDFARQKGVGLGGPDVVPWRKGQMKNAYPFFNANRGKLPLVAMAVQEPTLTYVDPHTGKPFTRAAIEHFATSYLGVDIIFWTPAAPWLAKIN